MRAIARQARSAAQSRSLSRSAWHNSALMALSWSGRFTVISLWGAKTSTASLTSARSRKPGLRGGRGAAWHEADRCPLLARGARGDEDFDGVDVTARALRVACRIAWLGSLSLIHISEPTRLGMISY